MVKIYTTDTCPKCIAAKEFFKENKVEYTEVNVAEDMEGREEMIKISRSMMVPVINIDGEIIIGFDKEKIISALKK